MHCLRVQWGLSMNQRYRESILPSFWLPAQILTAGYAILLCVVFYCSVIAFHSLSIETDSSNNFSNFPLSSMFSNLFIILSLCSLCFSPRVSLCLITCFLSLTSFLTIYQPPPPISKCIPAECDGVGLTEL